MITTTTAIIRQFVLMAFFKQIPPYIIFNRKKLAEGEFLKILFCICAEQAGNVES